jgi:hypothetical protein
LHGSRFQRAVTERSLQNASDRDDIIGDIISSNMSNMDRRAGAQKAHVGCIIARFDD